MNKKTLVLGASGKLNRYSNLVIRKLVGFGYETVAYGLTPEEVFAVHIDTELIPYKNIDTVTIYLDAFNQKEYYDYVLSLDPNRVIFNPGAENPEFYTILNKHNIDFEVACTLTLLATNQY